MAYGLARRLDAPVPGPGATVPEGRREAERARALAGREEAAEQIDALAARLSGPEAEIVATGALLARDPALVAAVEDAAAAGRPAAAALVEAADALGAPLRELDDSTFSLRADDLSSVGRRAARLPARPAAEGPATAERAVLVAVDLGPADVAELDASVVGVALGAGGVTAHAAIVARSLGLPMVVGLGQGLNAVEEGTPVVVDGGRGRFVAAPDRDEVVLAERDVQERIAALRRAAAERDLPAATRDGHRVRVLANVASRVEVDAALAAGAEGVGLLRTELAF